MKLKGKESRSIRCSKKKKEPIKVVYISNPIKVTTSASKFRALVQQLTGQDAADDLLPDLHPARFPESTTSTHDDDNNNNEFMFNPDPNSSSTATPQKNIGLEEIISSREQPEKSNSNAQFHVHYDDDDDDHEQQQQQLYDVDGLFVPEMIDNFGIN